MKPKMITLGQLKLLLDQQPASRVVRCGFGEPHSYRGYYDRVSFPPRENVTIAQMREFVEQALDETFEGWKGGEYTYCSSTPVHFAHEGTCDIDTEDPMPSEMWLSILGIE